MIFSNTISVYTPPAYFTLFGFEIRFYGIIIGMAILIAIFLARTLAKYRDLPKDIPFDIALVCVPIGIVGARLFHVLSHLEDYTFIEALQIWNGGLAIFGAVIFGAIGILIYCYFKKINFFKIADMTVVVLLLAQAIGRWGNYFNQELYGPKVNFNFFPFSVWIEMENAFCLGMFFIESLWNLGGFFLLLYLLKKTKKLGIVSSTYFVWYGFGRFFTEMLRTEGSYIIGALKFWQLFAIIAVIIGVAGIIYFSLRKTNDKGEIRCLK